MYLCICCDITEKDVEENPKLKRYIGSVCGGCISDGGVLDFDRVRETIVDSTDDHDTIE